jgi:hypothetical protein
MDPLFHGLSAAVLARHLGERRRWGLLVAAGLGIWPDLVMAIIRLDPTWGGLYSVSHSLAVNGTLGLLVGVFSPASTFGGVLHILTDALTHDSSTHHLLHPWAHPELPIGLNWMEPKGYWLTLSLWLALLATWPKSWWPIRRKPAPPPDGS